MRKTTKAAGRESHSNKVHYHNIYTASLCHNGEEKLGLACVHILYNICFYMQRIGQSLNRKHVNALPFHHNREEIMGGGGRILVFHSHLASCSLLSFRIASTQFLRYAN